MACHLQFSVSFLCYALPFLQSCLLSMANCLASADTCWLCSLHHSQHFWWPSQPSCHPCHYCHWSHFTPKGSGLYFCSDLWSLLWNADGGEVTYPICWLPPTLLDAHFPATVYYLAGVELAMISQWKFICPSLSSMRTCHYVHFPHLRHHFCLDQSCATASENCYVCGACQVVHAPVSSTLWVLQAGLVPGSYVGMGNNGTGCFTRGTDVTMGRSPITGRHTPQSIQCRALCRAGGGTAVQMHAARCVA